MRLTISNSIIRILSFASLGLFLGMTGCATLGAGKGPQTSAEPQAKRIEQLEQQLRRAQLELEQVRERNLVLEQKRLNSKAKGISNNIEDPAMNSVPMTALSGSGVGSAANTAPPARAEASTAANKNAPPHSASSPSTSGEELLYSKALESYRKHDVEAMQKSVEILLKTYRDSIFADNALYLASVLAIEKNQTARAGRYLDQILTQYPHGNKAVAALFAKGMLEKRLGNPKGAKASLKKVLAMYPGSPEAIRATLELKVLDINGAKPSGRLQ